MEPLPRGAARSPHRPAHRFQVQGSAFPVTAVRLTLPPAAGYFSLLVALTSVSIARKISCASFYFYNQRFSLSRSCV